MRKNHRRNRGHRPLWMYLVYVILIGGIFGATTYARYTSQVTGIGTATVARFAVNSDVDNITVNVPNQVGESIETPFVVSNVVNGMISEVKLEYTIQAAFVCDVPFKYSLVDETVEGKGTRETVTDGAAGSSTSFINIGKGTMPMGDSTTHSYRLVITWPETANDANYAGSSNAVTLKVDISQADPSIKETEPSMAE
ncbi:MAG: hypothetical protein KHZ58_18820 [Hungatella hathewayi]|nr:hypothetical protein [Hungatella hathewayi]